MIGLDCLLQFRSFFNRHVYIGILYLLQICCLDGLMQGQSMAKRCRKAERRSLVS